MAATLGPWLNVKNGRLRPVLEISLNSVIPRSGPDRGVLRSAVLNRTQGRMSGSLIPDPGFFHGARWSLSDSSAGGSVIGNPRSHFSFKLLFHPSDRPLSTGGS